MEVSSLEVLLDTLDLYNDYLLLELVSKVEKVRSKNWKLQKSGSWVDNNMHHGQYIKLVDTLASGFKDLQLPNSTTPTNSLLSSSTRIYEL